MGQLSTHVPGLLDRSEEEWAEHDSRVRAATETAKRRNLRKRFKAKLEELARWGVPAKDLPLVAAEEGLIRTPALDAVSGAPGGPNSPNPPTPEGALLIILSGGVGCGKTTAASWWLVHGAHEVSPYIHVKSPCFITAPWVERHSRYDHAAMGRLEHSRALVIDDLGMEYLDSKGNFLADIDAVVDTRYRNMLPTVITTNLQSGDFKERYGRRLRDRVVECGCFYNVNGPSLRSRGGRR